MKPFIKLITGTPKRWPVRALAILLFAAILLEGCISFHSAPVKMVWDLRKGFTPAAVEWPPSVAGEIYAGDGSFDLTIVDDKGKVVLHEEHVFSFTCVLDHKKLKQLSWAVVHFRNGENVEQAYHHARRILADWYGTKRDFDELDEYYAQIAAGKFYGERWGGGFVAITLLSGGPANRLNRECSICIQLG